ncbi:MAG: hypothetical protein Q7S78_01400 [Candidatus Azambacteria bacterium]|nr:hypothetical protein [Candidatus Azambacteria bacterium]
MFNFLTFLSGSFILLEIRFPKIFGATVSNEEKLAAMEHFYNSIGDIKPYIVFEIAVPEKGTDIGFFIAVPEKLRGAIEKQIAGFFPEAEIEAANNFNIINNQGAVSGAVLKLKNNGRAPLQTYKKLQTGALGLITNAVSSLKENGEGAAFQILIKPREKNLFETNIRIVSSAHTKEGADKILSGIEDAFTQFELPGFDTFYSFRPQGETLEKLIHDFSFRLFNKKEATWFSAEELTGVFHWPIIKIESEKTRFLKAKATPPPSISPISGITLGKNYFREQETTIKLSPLDRRRHIHVTGQSTAGKKQFLLNLIKQDINGGAGIGVIDSAGDLIKTILDFVPRTRRNDIILFKPADAKQSVDIGAGNIIENGKIFLADLSKNAVDETGGIFWERVLANKFLMAASEYLRKRERIINRDFHLYMNDFHDLTADYVAKIISETAKKQLNLNLVLANQNVFFDNIGTLVAFRSNPDNAAFLFKHFQSVFNKADLVSIDDNHAHVKMLINGNITTPFTIKVEN